MRRTGRQRPVISGASHWLMMDKPDEFNRIVRDFLLATSTASQ